ncbi:hypothetical protein [Haloactinomyces albus]|uniref:Uncharacterized protein n=1 Tax=Haloactinomyces albus TaxID=1352928 RepID=A0AAE4CJD6_9ACTN|nr:hypothetical protein [Haloactinomyces albus]MDR7299845.1 hypothetical protein [Haloactinomyces albus]
MTNTAHLLTVSAGRAPRIVVCDDQGAPITDVPLSSTCHSNHVDRNLRVTGWRRSAEWAITKDGWLAPVVPS